MLLIKLEYHPHGDATRARKLGDLVIANEGVSSGKFHDYEAILGEPTPAVTGTRWSRATSKVLGFERSGSGAGLGTGAPVWLLVAEALRSVLLKMGVRTETEIRLREIAHRIVFEVETENDMIKICNDAQALLEGP